eukprot:gene6746-biopygen11395
MLARGILKVKAESKPPPAASPTSHLPRDPTDARTASPPTPTSVDPRDSPEQSSVSEGCAGAAEARGGEPPVPAPSSDAGRDAGDGGAGDAGAAPAHAEQAEGPEESGIYEECGGVVEGRASPGEQRQGLKKDRSLSPVLRKLKLAHLGRVLKSNGIDSAAKVYSVGMGALLRDCDM